MSEDNNGTPNRVEQIKEAHRRRKSKDGPATLFPKGRPLPTEAPCPHGLDRAECHDCNAPPAKATSKTDRVREVLKRLGPSATRAQVEAEVGEPCSSPLVSTQRTILFGRNAFTAGQTPEKPAAKSKAKKPRDYKREKEQAKANRLKRAAAAPAGPSDAEPDSRIVMRNGRINPDVTIPLAVLVSFIDRVRAIGGPAVAQQVLQVMEG